MKSFCLGLIVFLFSLVPAHAGEADVIKVESEKAEDGTYRFEVTVSHHDMGWEHYADKWDILGPDGSLLVTRTLYHPHDIEQPFTRSLSGVTLPAGITEVTVRAHDSIHDYGGQVITLKLPE